MFRTVFGKIMMLFVVILLVSLYASGLMMSRQIRSSYVQEAEDQLVAVAEDVERSVMLYHAGSLTQEQLAESLEAKSWMFDDVIWVLMNDETLIAGGDFGRKNARVLGYSEVYNYYTDAINSMDDGNIIKMSNDNGPLHTAVMTVAMPILHEDQGNEYIFVSRQSSSLNAPLRTAYKQIMLSVAIAALVSTLMTYFFTRSMLRPLASMTKSAQQLSRGRFDVSLAVRSQDELGQLARTFNVLAADLKKHEETKDSFVANVSHELRSPLTSMQGLLQGVIDGTIPPENAKHYLEVVLGETKRLNILINDMLDLVKIESGQFPLEIEKIDINELVRRVLITFESKIEAKKIQVEVDFQSDRELVRADGNRIYQVIQNITDNAIKFTPEGGRLKIATTGAGAHVFVSINNSGEPISQSVLPYLFDRFYKVDEGRSRMIEGTGIGLSIVKKILEEHRQRIWVESDDVTGTTFTFTLKKA